jgi:hypothetical protein
VREAERLDIDRLVRGTLGCGCPDEVFHRIEVGSLALPGGCGLVTRLLIGDRLLVYVAVPTLAPAFRQRLAALAQQGRRERDHLGLNRFRLVLVAYGADLQETAAREAFQEVLGGDDRAHVHVVPRHELPLSLLPGAPRPRATPRTVDIAP